MRQQGYPSSLARASGSSVSGSAPGTSLGFALFVLANLVLFVRPSDTFPDLIGMEFYRWMLVATFVVSFPAVLQYLVSASITTRPIDLCVFALLPLYCLSSLAINGLDSALDIGIDFAKILVYYLLLVSLVTTPRRLRVFLGFLIVFAAVVTVVAALDYYKAIEIPRGFPEPGKAEAIEVNRMYGPGIFQDPNDICVLITTCMILLIGRLADRRGGLARWAWLVPLAVLAFGFYLTRSRGGMLALLAGAAIVVRVKYGWRRAIFLGILALPVLFLVGGRQVEISHTTNTGQSRIQLWNDGLVMFRANPLFGVAHDGYREKAGQVAHNSYMQAFAELGFVGGMLFLGAAVLAVTGLYRLNHPVVTLRGVVNPQFVDAEVHQMYPYVLGAVIGYATGMMTLSLNLLVVTYTFLGLAGVFLAMAATRPSVERDRFDAALLVRLAGLSLLFLVGMFVFVRMTFQP
jgi:O-antigen ligase